MYFCRICAALFLLLSLASGQSGPVGQEERTIQVTDGEIYQAWSRHQRSLKNAVAAKNSKEIVIAFRTLEQLDDVSSYTGFYERMQRYRDGTRRLGKDTSRYDVATFEYSKRIAGSGIYHLLSNCTSTGLQDQGVNKGYADLIEMHELRDPAEEIVVRAALLSHVWRESGGDSAVFHESAKLVDILEMGFRSTKIDQPNKVSLIKKLYVAANSMKTAGGGYLNSERLLHNYKQIATSFELQITDEQRIGNELSPVQISEFKVAAYTKAVALISLFANSRSIQANYRDATQFVFSPIASEHLAKDLSPQSILINCEEAGTKLRDVRRGFNRVADGKKWEETKDVIIYRIGVSAGLFLHNDAREKEYDSLSNALRVLIEGR